MATHIEDTRCVDCGGKGFHWKRGAIVSHRNGEVIADTVTAGERCQVCAGTGIDNRPPLVVKSIIVGAVCCLPLYLVIWLLLHL